MADREQGPERAVPLAEAAARLGLTTDALRMRIRRGTARGFKRDGQVYVWLGAAGEAARAAAPEPRPAAGSSEADPWPALVALQREEIARLIRETERLNARLDRHLDEAREMRQMLQREQVLRQQEQALRRDVQNLLDRLIAHPALSAALPTPAPAPAPAPGPAPAPAPGEPPATPNPNQDLADMLQEIGQSLRELEARAAADRPARRATEPHRPEPRRPEPRRPEPRRPERT